MVNPVSFRPAKRQKDPEEVVDVIESIVALAEARNDALREIQELRAQEAQAYGSRRREITERHHAANLVLVQAIEAAVKKGVPRTEILARLDISRSRYYQIRDKVTARERERRRRKACEAITPEKEQ